MKSATFVALFFMPGGRDSLLKMAALRRPILLRGSTFWLFCLLKPQLVHEIIQRWTTDA